jgi:DNA-directed RNA polymerase specialized sigma24 family protein
MATTESDLTAARLRELLDYDPITGVFTWRSRPSRYRFIEIDGWTYKASRLAWLWMTGSWPKGQIDHANLKKDDDRWTNLREAPSQSAQSANRGRLRKNKAMLRLRELGFGTRWIARALGVSRNTVKSYIEAGGWRPYKRLARRKVLDGQASWLRERFERHRGKPTSFARNWPPRRILSSVFVRSSGRLRRTGGNWRRRRVRRCGLRPRPASSFRSILASAWLRSPAPRSRRSCLSRRLGFRGDCMCARSATSVRRGGLLAWKARSPSLAG